MISVHVKKVFTERLCEKIISFHSNWAEDNGYIDVKKNDTNIRDCKIYKPLPIENTNTSWIENEIIKNIFIVNNNIYNFNLSGDFQFHLLRYDLGGHYKTHIDIGNQGISSTRKISFTLLLNDSFEGGNLNFVGHNEENLDLNIGDMVIFPSYLPHKIKPITSGVRWAFVGWALGEKHFV